jgi:hypothetical protein
MGEETLMIITLGGLLMFFGGVLLLGTIAYTLFGLFATSMSDNPQERFIWRGPIILASFSAGLIFLGQFSGL